MTEITRILFVDNEKSILEAFSFLLEDLGYSVSTASNRDEALSIASQETFDVAFIDQFLGPEKGLDLMAQLAKIDPELYFVIITGNGSTELAVECLKRGASDFISKPLFIADLVKSIGHVRQKREFDIQKREMVLTLEAKVDEKTRELKAIYFSVLSTLAQAMEKKDMGTYGHCKRVSYYSGLAAAALDLGEQERENLKAAAMLHDIGKIGISDFVLGKRGPLSEEEIRVVRNHPVKGVEILRPVKQFEPILPGILHHHENYDGSGYPAGLSGEEIPLIARIISVADTYDAILSKRPYRSASKHEKAEEELLRHAGRQFDLRIAEAFVTACSRYRHLLGEATLAPVCP